MRLAILCLLSVLLPSVVNAEARIALLIGNERYSEKVGPLNNPHSDVALVGAALKAVGFTVMVVKDADYRSTDAAIKRHIAAVRKEGEGAISFVYYSGRGAADPDTKINYLIPVDVENADNQELWNYSINLNTLVENLRAQAPGATHYVVFDACRNELNLSRRGQKGSRRKRIRSDGLHARRDGGIRDRAGSNCLRQRYRRRALRQGVGRRNREAWRRLHAGLFTRCPSRAA